MVDRLPTLMGLLGVPASFLFGAWTPLLGILLAFIMLDILTGLAKGFYNRELRSRDMSQGMIRKMMIFVVLIVANSLDFIAFGGTPVAKTATLFFYISMEGLSILENLSLMDVPLPNFIKDHLLVMRDKNNNISITKNAEKIIIETKMSEATDTELKNDTERSEL